MINSTCLVYKDKPSTSNRVNKPEAFEKRGSSENFNRYVNGTLKKTFCQSCFKNILLVDAISIFVNAGCLQFFSA